jgi:glycine reductase complex component B subunit gamma
VVVVSAIPIVPLGAGANRVVAGVRVEHVCGDPGLSDAADKELRRRIVTTALRALQTPVDGPTLFDPASGESREAIHAA